jgi:hypothetical protein
MQWRSVRVAALRNVLSFGVVALGCNALLDNDPRTFDPGAGGFGGSRGGAGPTAGAAGGNSDSGGAGMGGGAGAAGGDAGAKGNAEAGAFSNGGGEANAGSANAGQATAGDGGAGGPSCACTPKATDPKQVACGLCGTATVTRTCKDDCQWGEYGTAGACSMPAGACMPNSSGTRVAACDRGGWRYQARTCKADCTWNAWTDTSTCQYPPNECDGCACVSACTDDETNGTTCLWIDCAEATARTECDADIKRVCGSAKQPVTFKDWRPF